MAKKKKKKKGSSTTSRLSPENYIKKRARSLPISECYLTENWEETGMANILIARRHVSGGRTYGAFLIDLKCLGIKDADYNFNIPEIEFEEFVQFTQEKVNAHPCEYELAHNIIYGALEFAEEYGFSPHKNWSITQYILAEDDEKIPLMDIPMGEDGTPCYIPGPDDDRTTQEKILKTLERTAGLGNFQYIAEEPFFGEDDPEDHFSKNAPFPFDDEADDLDDFKNQEEEEELFTADELRQIMQGEKNPTLLQRVTLSSIKYRTTFPEEDYIDLSPMKESIEINKEKIHPYISTQEDEDKLATIIDSLEDTEEGYQDAIRHFLKENGPNPALLTLLFIAEREDGNDIPEDVVQIMEEQYPEDLYFRFLHAYARIEENELEKAWELLGEDFILTEAFPHRENKFYINECYMFHLTTCTYLIEKGELGNAINYGLIAITIDEDNPNSIQMAMHLEEEIWEKIDREET